MPEPAAGTVNDKSVKPPGVLPQNAQSRLLAALALLMVLVIAFSGRKAPEKKPAAPPPIQALDPNRARIQEYQQRIEEQVKRLQDEQEQLNRAKQALDLPHGPGSGIFVPRDPSRELAHAPYRSAEGPLQNSEPPRPGGEPDWRKADREKRDYQSLYSSNVAVTLRTSALRVPSAGAPADAPYPLGVGASEADGAAKEAAGGKLYPVFEGTMIETVLTNRLDGSFSGPVNCMVSNAVYSRDFQKILIPKGSRVFGQVKPVDAFGQKRLAVVFHRLLMPNRTSVKLERMPGLNQLGETGLRDKVNNHYAQIFGVSLAIGAIAGLAQAGTRSSISAEESYGRGVSDSLSHSALRILDRYLNILPTLTIESGHRVEVYLTGDLHLPVYDVDSNL